LPHGPWSYASLVNELHAKKRIAASRGAKIVRGGTPWPVMMAKPTFVIAESHCLALALLLAFFDEDYQIGKT